MTSVHIPNNEVGGNQESEVFVKIGCAVDFYSPETVASLVDVLDHYSSALVKDANFRYGTMPQISVFLILFSLFEDVS